MNNLKRRREGDMNENNIIKIGAFNVNGINGKIDDCLQIVDEERLEMLFVSETWLKVKQVLSHRQMIVSLADTDITFSRGHHGLGLIIPAHLMETSRSWSITVDSVDRAYIVVKTATYVAIGMYLTGSMPAVKIKEIMERLRPHIAKNEQKPVVMIGDFNARLTGSGDTTTNQRGREVLRWMEGSRMQLVRYDTPAWTFQSIGSGHRSIVDLVWGNRTALDSATAKVLRSTGRAGSDHRQ